VNSERYFCRALARKMLNFAPEVVIWWTLKMYFWKEASEYAFRVMGLISFLLHCERKQSGA